MGKRNEKISIRITPNQGLVLSELSQALNTTYSMLIRTIVGSWIAENEDYLYKLIDRKKLESNPDYKIPEEDNNIFDE